MPQEQQRKWDETYKAKQRERGMVQVRFWIPEARRAEMEQIVEQWRVETAGTE